MSRAAGANTPDPEYGSLSRIGAVAAWMVAFLSVAEIVFFVIFPQPSTVIEWFDLFQEQPIIGLLEFWGLELPMYAMFAVFFLALYFVLRVVSKSWMALALTFALLGVAIFFATNNPFSMLTLSHQYAAAMTTAHRTALLGAGEALLANTNQRAVGGFNTGLFLVSVAGLIVSAVMLRSASFRRSTAILGILAWGLSLADYLRQAITSSVAIALLVIIPGAVLLVIWFVITGRRLWQLGQPGE